jgi:Cof subfamily protein (haloacid dehalogenase superfamily)
VTIPRLIATDLDGTLLNRDGVISPRTVAALRSCVQAGVDVVFVTGRPPRTVGPLAAAAGVEVTVICSNGTLIADPDTGDVTVAYEFASDDARQVVEQLRPVLPDAGFALESGRELWHDEAFRPGKVGGGARSHLVRPFDRVWAQADRIVKILARSPILTADQIAAAAASALRVPVEVSHSGANGLVEIAPGGATKGAALARLCAARGINAQEVVAFGDMPNDLPMLRWAGVSYAVANAHPDVLAVATRKAGAHDQDGVAMVLEELLAGGAGHDAHGDDCPLAAAV